MSYVKMKYKRTGKHISLSEIQKSLENLCNGAIRESQKTSLPIAEKILLRCVKYEDLKLNSQKALDQYKKNKNILNRNSSRVECAKKIYDGSGCNDGEMPLDGAFSLYGRPGKIGMTLNDLKKNIERAKRGMNNTELSLDNINTAPNKTELIGNLDELEKKIGTLSDQDKDYLLKNCNEVTTEFKELLKQMNQDTALHLLIKDLDYIESGKSKEDRDDTLASIREVKKEISKAVKATNSLIKFLNRHLPKEKIFKDIKSAEYYINQIKTTAHHYGVVLNMVMQKQEKRSNALENYFEENSDDPNVAKIRKSKEYEKFIKSKEAISDLFEKLKPRGPLS